MLICIIIYFLLHDNYTVIYMKTLIVHVDVELLLQNFLFRFRHFNCFLTVVIKRFFTCCLVFRNDNVNILCSVYD